MGTLFTVGETPLRFSPPDREQFVGSETVTMRAAGTESNVAIAAANLGADARWVSKMPTTPIGKRVVSEIHQYGAKTDVTWSDSGRLGIEFYQRSAAPREEVVVHDHVDATAASMTPGELPMERIQTADAVFAAGSTVALSETAGETIESVLRAVQADEGLTVFDLEFDPDIWSADTARDALAGIFDVVDVLIGNETQLRTVFARSGDHREVAHGIASALDVEMLVMTRSERGALVIEDSVLHESESVETETVDPDGQHDAFVGAFVQQLLEGATTERALTYGVAAAATCRTIPGPIPAIERSDVQRVAADL